MGSEIAKPKKRWSARNIILVVVGGVVLGCVCLIIAIVVSTKSNVANPTSTIVSSPTQPQPTATLPPTDTQTPEYTPTISLTPTITDTPTITQTPTKTPLPSNTPLPSKTFTPTANPYKYNGQGDSVIDITKPDPSGPAILKITYAGGGNFAIWNYDDLGNKIDLLVNTIGSYTGTRPIDFLVGENTARLEITASGKWTIEIQSLSEVRTQPIPGTITGTGDDVILLVGSNPDLLKIDASATHHNFVIWAYGTSRDLLVNEIGPYTGTVIAGPDTQILVIEAVGKWIIEVTTR
jgi:hypothetical protein